MDGIELDDIELGDLHSVCNNDSPPSISIPVEQKSGILARLANKSLTMAEVQAYQAEVGKETQSAKAVDDIIINCIICTMWSCTALVIAISFGILFSLPIAELIMATKYSDNMVCNSSFISPYVWLIVEGVTGLIFSICILIISIHSYVNNKNTLNSVLAQWFNIPLIIIFLFNCAWIIIGSVMFLRDCIDIEPKAINTIFWTTLIFHWVQIIRVTSSIQTYVLLNNSEEF